MDFAGARRAALLFWMIALVSASTWANGCDACHGDPRLYVTAPRLYDYYQDWITSPHKHAGVTCSECHGGDPDAVGKDAAHAGRLPVLDASSTVFFKRQPETCGRCHGEIAVQFRQSRHCAKVLNDERAPTCTTCHRAMNRRPYYRDVLRQRCEYCHSPGRGARRAEVIDRAAEILYRLNVIRFLLGWTAQHFNRQDWPGDSRREIETWRQAYHGALARVHSLELLSADQSSLELFAELRQVFDEHRGWPRARPGR